ncbi:MAG: hypothetical protein V3W51_05460 [Candidatus Brocadiales bacterium]
MAKHELVAGIEIVLRQAKLQMKLVEMVSSAEGLEVTNFAVVDLPPGGMRVVGPRLQNILKEQGFGAKTINAILPYPSIDYRQVSLPPMSKANAKTAAVREARKDLKFPAAELVTDFEVVGESEEKGLRRTELLIARAQSKDMEELFSMAKESRLRLNSLTVLPAALLNLLKIRGGTEDETLAMVHASADKGTIIISHQGNLRFPREFPLMLSAVSTERDKRLVAEIKRSLLFVKQQARGLTVKKILLLGEMIQPDVLANTITSETNVPTEVYAPISLDLSPLGERVHEFRELLPTLSIPLGLAWSGPEHSRLNLMSQRLAEQKRSHLAKVVIISTCAMLIILLGAKYFFLWQKAEPYKEDYAHLKQELTSLKPQTHNMREMQKEREQYASRRAFLDKMHGPGIPWGEILRILSLSVPKEMLLESVNIEEAEVGWILKISGNVTAEDAAGAQKNFNDFFSLFLTCPSLSNGEVNSLTIGPVPASGAIGAMLSRLNFTVSVRVQPKESPGGIKG